MNQALAMDSLRTCVVFISLFFLPIGLGSVQGIKTYNYGHDTSLRTHSKRQFSQSPLVGSLPLVDGQPQPRLEIRDLQKNEDQWNLYILALSWMQYTPQDDPFSWYQIAGIHGAPGLTWGDVKPLPGNEKIGYCHHVSILFPTWHRPYLVLYEQTLYNIVNFIASLWPPEDVDRVQEAARRFRIPYWDWAITPPEGESVLPLSVGGYSTMNVSGPNGIQNISNPLFSFSFKPFNGSVFPDSPYNMWNETKRAPTPTGDRYAISNNSFVADSLDSHLPSYQQRLYNLFANYANYTRFSNEAWIGHDNNGTFDSIESLHDSIHTIGGGGWGHLAIIAYSAFDPLFFLHHANVDRIFAMWQMVHNNTYVVPMAAAYASHTQKQGDMEDKQTPLHPFSVNDTTFWTSDMVRDHKTFGYTYAEVANNSREEVVAAINRLYTDYSPATMSLRNSQEILVRSGHPVIDQSSDTIRKRHSHERRTISWRHDSSRHLPMNTVFKTTSDGKSYREWIANIVVRKHALKRSFLIYLFLGPVHDDSTLWQSSVNLVGSLGVFAHNGQPSEAGHGKVTGTIPLTSALIRMVTDGQVSSLESEDIEPFLRSTLELRVALLNGTIIDPETVDGLGVSIVSSVVVVPSTEDKLPRWGEFESHFDLVA